jgi:sensor histidine kinase YesM
VIWLVRVQPFRRPDWWRAALIHLGVSPCVIALQLLWAVVLERMFWPGGVSSPFSAHFREAALRLTDFQVVTYMAVLAAGVALEYFRRYRAGLFAAERLRTEMVQAQLLALRSQLNPHFLFNALNSVVSLMDRDVPSAQRMVARIGELLRLSLGADEAEVPLERELALVNQYLEIERIRFGDRLTFRVDVPEDVRDFDVPNLMLQPLVENAIVHGVGPRPGPGRVTVEARRDGDTLVLRVVDDGLGLQASGGGAGHGIGVRNTRARLQALYGDTASLTMRAPPEGGCVAEIRLPLAATRGV